MTDFYPLNYQIIFIRQKLLFIIFLIVSHFTFSQYKQLTPNAEISVLTIGPGYSLNDSFGHSAYRVKDSLTDIVFNYGVYDFKTPNFYTKFAQGKLNYKIDANYYKDFKDSYIRQNRTIKEQVLNLTDSEKQQVFNFLSKNYEPENQFYLYDFFYDNCATKIKDVLVIALDDKIKFTVPKSFESKTFRTLIQQNLHWNSWGSFGIDLALGSVIDREATPEEHMFLPEYIYDFFGSAEFKIDKKKVVVRDQIIYQKSDTKSTINFFSSPMLILGLIGLFIVYKTFRDYKANKRSRWLDASIFVITGSIGIVILLLWFATDHEATANNYNLLWAFAFNLFLIIPILKIKPKNWFFKYIKFLLFILFLLILHWLMGIQRFAVVLIPLIIALIIRYIYLIKFYQKQLEV